MTIREKLVKLLKLPIHPRIDADPAEVVADYLLDNGVTVQQWIPVSERLPEGVGYVLTVKNRHYAVWPKSYVRCYSFMFTHWMPLPEPPTEV